MTCREKILSEEYEEVVIDFSWHEENFGLMERMPLDEYCYQELIPGVLDILHVPVSGELKSVLTGSDYEYITSCYGLMQINEIVTAFNPSALINTGILSLQGRPLELTGKGVILCFLDTGIQYENEVFRNADGSSRILAIWDQTIQNGEPPANMFYGTEYTKEMIDAALASDNPRSIVPSTDTNGHGTAIASIAAGSRLEENRRFVGAAPDADIVVVKVKEAKQRIRNFFYIAEDAVCYEQTDLLLALKYLDSFAVAFSKPIVICLGMGGSLGSHDSLGPLGTYLSYLGNKKSRVIVCAAGNEGNSSHHYEGRIISGSGTPYEDMEIRVGEGELGFVMEIWGEVPSLFTISIRTPGGEVIPRIPLRIGKSSDYSFIYDQTRINLIYRLVEQSTGSELIAIRFSAPTPGVWSIRVFAEGNVGASVFHAWLPISEFLTSETYFLRPNPYTTITEPAYAQNCITVTAYDDTNNSFYTESGRGYSRMGEIKPDLAAPGVQISAINGKFSGTSMAAAITAGASAQFMQWAVIEKNDPIVASANVKNYFIRGAKRSSDNQYPNREWGYGMLDVAGTFDVLAGI